MLLKIVFKFNGEQNVWLYLISRSVESWQIGLAHKLVKFDKKKYDNNQNDKCIVSKLFS